jgi:quercetin dioxygenase-like cupin family protein
MQIIRASGRPTKQAPSDRFTGVVWQDEVATGAPPARVRATMVSFTPGARTAWHTHPGTQVLYAVSGVGRVQCKGEPAQLLQPGDTAVIPPAVLHWHGAAPDRLFAHLAITETDERGEAATLFEHVSDADYAVTPAPAK